MAPIAQPYYGARGHLSIHDGLITYDDCLIIPRCLQGDILQRIHEGHQGITKCQERAHQSVRWPKIGEDIVQIVEQTARSTNRQQQKSPKGQAMADAGRILL